MLAHDYSVIMAVHWVCQEEHIYKTLDPVTLVSTRFVFIITHLNAIFYLNVRR